MIEQCSLIVIALHPNHWAARHLRARARQPRCRTLLPRLEPTLQRQRWPRTQNPLAFPHLQVQPHRPPAPRHLVRQRPTEHPPMLSPRRQSWHPKEHPRSRRSVRHLRRRRLASHFSARTPRPLLGHHRRSHPCFPRCPLRHRHPQGSYRHPGTPMQLGLASSVHASSRMDPRTL